jgi:hypothetical protein
MFEHLKLARSILPLTWTLVNLSRKFQLFQAYKPPYGRKLAPIFSQILLRIDPKLWRQELSAFFLKFSFGFSLSFSPCNYTATHGVFVVVILLFSENHTTT